MYVRESGVVSSPSCSDSMSEAALLERLENVVLSSVEPLSPRLFFRPFFTMSVL